jgi:hypothetical protein
MKIKIGYMLCPDCQKRVVVRKNELDTLFYRCDECDGNGYSKSSEARHALWLARITDAPAPAPAPAPAAAPKPAPAPKCVTTLLG